MSAPKMPRHTCPIIDNLKARIESAYKLADEPPEDGGEDALRQCLRDIACELHGEDGVLEDLRDANLGLRNCAEYWQEEAARLEAAVDA